MRNFKTALTCVIFIASIFITVNAQTDRFPAAWEKIRSQYLAELKAAGIVGSSFVFLKDNKVIAHEY